MQEPIRLSEHITVDSEMTFGDFIASPDDPLISLDPGAIKREVDAMIEKLEKRTKGVIEMRFGLNGKFQSSLEECGMAFNISRERVRQIENDGRHKLKQFFKNNTVKFKELLNENG